ncbi:MAG: phosphatidate cytidylyltransferase [Lachnospiraceae bacterium]|nr:phosphatidate cytidylyltransferase [Lachnospiraceae bacterium]
MAGFRTRVCSAAVLVAVLGLALFYGGVWLWTLLLFLSEVGLYEFYRAVRKKEKADRKVTATEIVGYTGCLFYYVVMLLSGNESHLFYTVIGILILLMFVFVIRFPEYDSDEFIRAYFGVIYVCVTLSFVYLIRVGVQGGMIVWIIFISSWICDTCAYIVGVLIGKHKLVPALSPKKSVEGAIGGVIGASAVGYLYGSYTGMGGVSVMIISAVGAVISQFGDLTASALKRSHNIKDYGKLIPGHGGVLDRFDSVIITSAVTYILSRLLLK